MTKQQHKGSHDVVSMLFHFFHHYLDQDVKSLHIFLDSYGGQNKNHTFIKFLHYIITQLKRLESIQVTYPVRGDSFMKNDTNMALIPKCARAETPDARKNVIREAR